MRKDLSLETPGAGEPRWILAYDSTCGSCSRLSVRVSKACDEKLETRPLNNPEVAGWRLTVLGPDAASEPTLVRVRPADVTVWTGRSMVGPLVRHLGLRSSVAVTLALGSLRNEIAADDAAQQPGVTRKTFFRLGAGAAIAGALVVTGSMPAYAANPVESWVKARVRKGDLPRTYDAITALPVDYRRAILAELSPAARSALWVEQLMRHRDQHQLTPQQSAVMQDALRFAGDPRNFVDIGKVTTTAADVDFIERARAAFGRRGEAAIFSVLGAAPMSPASNCGCAVQSDWCLVHGEDPCVSDICVRTTGCGTFGRFICDGFCGGGGV
jgi:hypothetical protein